MDFRNGSGQKLDGGSAVARNADWICEGSGFGSNGKEEDVVWPVLDLEKVLLVRRVPGLGFGGVGF
jgi:hypothetical protein